MSITDPAVATAVINEAKARGIYPGEMPETDEAKLAQGNELLRLAEQAKGAGVQGEAVIAVLNAAGQGDPGNPFGAGGAPAPAAPAPAAPPVPAAAPPAALPPPPAPPAPPVAPEPPSEVEIIGPDGTHYMVDPSTVDQYITGGYTLAEVAPPEPPAAPPVPPAAPVAPAAPAAPSGPADPSQYSTTAPWDTYDKDKIPDIVTRIETVLRDQGETAKPLLAHVWEYESNNKERTRLLDKLKDIASNGVQSAPPAAPPAAPAVPQAGVDPTAPFAQPQAAPAPVAAPPVPQTPPDVSTPEFDTMVPPFENGATQRAETMINKELPVPPVVGQAPDLPGEFTGLSDVQVRSYQAQFNALQARAHYMLALAEGYANDAKLVADNAIDTFIRENTWEGKVTVKEMEAKALALPEIQHARRVQHEWGEASRQLRARRDIYQFTCERLSREQTGRADERSTTR